MSSVATAEWIVRAAREGLLLVLLVSAPPLLASLIVGLVFGTLQTATQLQDPSLLFVPKLVAVVLVLVALGPLLGAQVLRFAHAMFSAIPIVR